MNYSVLLRPHFTSVMKSVSLIALAAISFLLTVNIVKAAPLTGNYTINSAIATGSGNFQSFNAFRDSLSANGISGNVTATVTPGSGPYVEKVDFTTVTGASASARVTIEGSGETITSLTNTTDRYVVRLTNVQYFTINNLTVLRDTAATSGFYGFHIHSIGNNITISNCHVDMTGATSTLVGGYVASGSPTSILEEGSFFNINITGNTSVGGGYGVSVYGSPGAGLTTGVVISNNTLNSVADNGIYLANNNGTIVSGNTINMSSGGSGIQLAQSNNANVLVEKNTISATNALETQTFRGIYVFGSSAVNPNKVINNLIWNMNATRGNVSGLATREGGEFYFNTVILNDTSATGNVSFGFEEESLSNTGAVVKNNIFYVTRPSANYGAGIALASTSTVATAITSDHNVIYVTGSNHAAVRKGTVNTNPPTNVYATLADWQAASTQDSNSFQLDPFFASAVLPQPTNGVINNGGTPIAGVTDDITGSAGNRATTPDPGAYEFTPAADDAAITGFTPPSMPFCGANLDVQFVLTNAGGDPLNTVTINWTVNGVAQTAVNLSGLALAPANDTLIVLGTVPVADNTSYDFTAAASNPNGNPDANTVNDSFTEAGWSKGFIGTYTIDNTGTPSAILYTTFQAMADALVEFGVCGAVEIEVLGTSPYTEQVTFSAIPGAGSTNTVTLNGNARELQYNSTAAAPFDFTLKLDGVTFFNVDGLSVKGLNATNGRGIFITNSARDLVISNNTVEVSKTATASTTFGILVGGANWLLDGSESRNLTISGNTVIGGYTGIQFSGIHWSQPIQNSIITSNAIQDFYGFGVYLSYTSGVTVMLNDISRPTRTNSGSDSQTPAGIIVSAGSSGFSLEKNRIYDFSLAMTGSELQKISRGIYVSGTTTAPTSGDIVNNLIFGFTNTAAQYGIQNNSTVGPINIYHNTVALDDTANTATSTYTTSALYLSNSSAQRDIDIRNNIFYITRGGASNKRVIDISSANTAFNSDNNVLYVNAAAGTNVIGKIGTPTYATLVDWQTATTEDSSSVSADPEFAAPAARDYTPTSAAVDNIGTSVGVIEDIQSQPRNPTTPDAGAFEFSLCGPPAAPASITGSASVCANAIGVTYTAAAVAGASAYNWIVPAGASITNGQGTETITVDFGATAGDVSVTAEDSCGVSAATTITVGIASLPGVPAAINGVTAVCAGATDVAYTTTTVVGATSYTWTAPTGANITGQGTTSVTIDFGTTSGPITVQANNDCGSGSAIAISVTVNPAPTASLALPVDTICIFENALTLSGGSPAGGSYSGAGVSGGVFDPSAAGAGTHTITYTYQDTTACPGMATDVIVVDVCSGIKDADLVNIDAYPNPFSTSTTVYLNTGNKRVTLSLYDTAGKLVTRYQPANDRVVISREHLPAGMYTLIVEEAARPIARKKLLIQ